MEKRAITIINETVINPKDSIAIHINYNKSLTLKELSELLDLINKAINDINRENGINNVTIGRNYAAEVKGVESGSIVLSIFINLVTSISCSILGNFLYDRIKSIGAKKDKDLKTNDNAYPVVIIVDGDIKLIDINITKPIDDDLA